MKHIYAALTLLFTFCITSYPQTVGTYNWSDPKSLTPAYPAPNADNRYGEYIGKVTFTSGPTSLYIDDSDIKELSQSARFLYGYLTQAVEMRAYPNSVINFSCSDDLYIDHIEMEGPKVGTDYLQCVDGSLEFVPSADYTSGIWRASADSRQAALFVHTTINCSVIRIVCRQEAGVSDITTDPARESWYTLQGIQLSEPPVFPGLYIRRSAGHSALHYIR